MPDFQSQRRPEEREKNWASLWFPLFILIFLIGVPIVSAASLVFQLVIGNPPGEPITAAPLLDSDENEGQDDLAVVAGSTASVYLPLITTPILCDLSNEEQAVATLAMADVNQGRPTMSCDPILLQVARERAMDMAQRSYFGHTNPDGFGPNYLVKAAGYTLPSWYSNDADGNNIESIAAGYSTAESVWSAWLSSSGHRAHILAESAFWQSQTNYGIGYYYDPASPYRHYWVFLSAPPEE